MWKAITIYGTNLIRCRTSNEVRGRVSRFVISKGKNIRKSLHGLELRGIISGRNELFSNPIIEILDAGETVNDELQ